MPSIFISYRREDSIATAGRIHDHLERTFGESEVFLDTEDINPGVQWEDYLSSSIQSVQVVLVIIGANWTRIMKDRAREANDFVRFEIEQALENRHITIIPVLLDNTPMPLAANLPESIRDLTRWNATRVRAQDFRSDMVTLEAAIRTATKLNTRPTVKSAPAQVERKPERGGNGVIWGLAAVLLLIVLAAGIVYVAMPDLFGGGDTPEETAVAAVSTEEATEEPTLEPTVAPTDAPTDVPAESPTEAVMPTEMPCTVTARSGGASVRTDPDPSADRLGIMSADQSAPVVARTLPDSSFGEWYQVNVDGIVRPGWVNVVSVDVNGACDDVEIFNG